MRKRLCKLTNLNITSVKNSGIQQRKYSLPNACIRDDCRICPFLLLPAMELGGDVLGSISSITSCGFEGLVRLPLRYRIAGLEPSTAFKFASHLLVI